MIGSNTDPQAAADKLHSVAMAAEKNLEQLATGLGQVGASPDVVKAVTQCAEITRKIATGLAKGGVGGGQQQAQAQPQQHTIGSATDAMMADRSAGYPQQ